MEGVKQQSLQLKRKVSYGGRVFCPTVDFSSLNWYDV